LPRGIALGIPLAFALALGGCSSSETASNMTSFSANATKSETPGLFTIPQEQMAHVQVVEVKPQTLSRTLRLTGAVAYNAFHTTPVISEVGGPVSRVLVVPGEHVHAGQALLMISSPDYSQMRAVYLKARDAFHVADDELYARAGSLRAQRDCATRPLAG
jgi:cobalt-zinc-cadmium efflux system membrane fusion protein